MAAEPPCGEDSGISACCLGFDLYRIPEVYSVEHSPPLVFDVDAVMEHYATLIFGHFTKRDAGASHSICSRSFQVRKLDTFVVRDIDVIVEVEIEPRHRRRSVCGLHSFLFLICVSRMSAMDRKRKFVSAAGSW